MCVRIQETSKWKVRIWNKVQKWREKNSNIGKKNTNLVFVEILVENIIKRPWKDRLCKVIPTLIIFFFLPQITSFHHHLYQTHANQNLNKMKMGILVLFKFFRKWRGFLLPKEVIVETVAVTQCRQLSESEKSFSYYFICTKKGLNQGEYLKEQRMIVRKEARKLPLRF